MAEQRERRRSKKNREEQPTEWQERVIQIRRVTKVVKGGKKLSFRAVVVVGNERGQVGVGVGKANDVIGAVRKGVVDGKKHLIEVPLTKGLSVPHPMQGAGGGATVLVMPAAPGTGVIAGGGSPHRSGAGGCTQQLGQATGIQQPPQQCPCYHRCAAADAYL